MVDFNLATTPTRQTGAVEQVIRQNMQARHQLAFLEIYTPQNPEIDAVIQSTRQGLIDWSRLRQKIFLLKQDEQQLVLPDGIATSEEAIVQGLRADLNQAEQLMAQQAEQLFNESLQTSRQTIFLTLFIVGTSFFVGGLWLALLLNYLRQRNSRKDKLAFEARRREVLLNLPGYADELDEVGFLQRGQEFAEALTGSKIAFIHFVNDDEQTIELVAWSKATLEHYCHDAFDNHYPVEQAGIWADALRQRQAVVINDYANHKNKKGLPEGHAYIERLISVPVIDENRVVMLTGVGNKSTPYTRQDVETVQLISNEIWRIARSKRLFTELTKSEERYRQAQAIAQIGHWELDIPTQKLFWSPEVYELM